MSEKNQDNNGSGREYECLRLDNQLCFPLYAAARKITGMYTPLLKPLGLTYTQYIVFLVLWEQDGIPVGDLCRRLCLDNGTVTPLLKKMENQGLLKRERSSEDERKVVVNLTEQGRALREQARSIPEEMGRCVDLEPEEAAELYRLLYKLIG